jgi:6-phosphogluconolactonase (cycloisomerase 2 family)
MQQSFSFIGKSVGVSLALLFLALLVGCDGAGGPATLQSVVVTPTSPSIVKGATQQFTATGHFSNGTLKDLTGTVTWTSSSTAVVTINNTGLATGVAVGGPITITAASGAVNGTTTLTVTPPTLQSITVTPANPSVGQGGTLQFTATGHFSDGSTQNITATVTWSSANTAIATVSATGLATGVSPGGPVNITATSGAISGFTGLTVTLPVPRFAFFGSINDNTLAVYAMDANTGQLRANGNVLNPSGGGGLHQLGLNPAGTFIYGTDQTAGNGVIDGYVVSNSGTLTQITGVNPLGFSVGTDPNCVLTDPAGKFLYVAAPGNGIRVFSIASSTGALTEISGSPFGIAAANGICADMDPGGKFLFVVNAGPTNANTVQPFSINSTTGALTAGTPVATGGTLPINLAVTPDGNFLYVVNETTNTVAGFSINGTSGALTAVSGSPFATDSIPEGIATDVTGKFLYVATAVGTDGYAIGSGGTLTALSGNPVKSSHPVASPGYLFLRADSSGRFLIGESNGGFADTLSITPSTGALTVLSSMVTRGNTNGIAVSHGPALTFTPKFAYVANTAGNSVSAFTVDLSTGALTAVAGSPFSTGASTTPKSVAADRTGKFLYTANSGTGDVSAFTINSDGSLTAVAGSPFSTGGTAPTSVFVDPSGRFLFAALSGSGKYAGFTINSSTGALTALASSPFTVGTTPMALTMDPSGNFLFIANSGSNNVNAKIIFPSTGTSTPIAGEPFAVGTNPQAVAVDATGNFLFVANTTGGTVSGFQIAPNGGGLTAIAGSPFTVGTTPSGIASDPTGKFLYVANSGSNNVSAFTISSAGALTAIAGSPFGVGTSPQSVSVDVSGKFLFVANSGSGNVSVFSINSSTGVLTQITGSPFAAGSGASSVALTGTVQ